MQLVWGEGAKSNPPCTAIQRLAVFDGVQHVERVPVIAANNLIGRLRRHAANRVLDVIAAKGERISIQTFSGLMCGAVTGNPDGRDITFEEYRSARANPYLGLFGGGPRMMRRYVRCFNAVPVLPQTQLMFERVRHPFLDVVAHGGSIDTSRLTQRWIFNRNDDLADLSGLAQASVSIDDFEAQISARQAAILAERPLEGEDRAKSKTTTRTFSAIEFVVPGVVFPVTFELDVSDAQMGLFLAALDSFARTERLGGYTRNGFGQFSLDDVVLVDPMGQVSRGLFKESGLNQGNLHVQQFGAAWLGASQELSAAALDEFFRLPTEKPKQSPRRPKASAA